MKYALNLGADGRVLSATYPKYAPADAVQVEELPEGNLHDYIYRDGAFVYDPIPKPEQPEKEPNTDDVLNALLGVKE
jgi:hypothetical protein